MRDGYENLPVGSFEVMMRAADADEFPALRLKPRDNLPAVTLNIHSAACCIAPSMRSTFSVVTMRCLVPSWKLMTVSIGIASASE